MEIAMNSLSIKDQEGRVCVVIKEEGEEVLLFYKRVGPSTLEFANYSGVEQGEMPINHPKREQARWALHLNGEAVLERR